MAIVVPRETIAQTSKVYRLGTLGAGAPFTPTSGDGAILIAELGRRGYTLGQNLAYDARGAAGRSGELPRLMQELKLAKVDVVVTVSYPAAVAAKASGVPTVIASGSGDPSESPDDHGGSSGPGGDDSHDD